MASINHFEYHVYGRPLRIVTDHKACMALKSSSNLNRCLLRFALALQDWKVEIVHQPGACHGNADSLSRQCWDRDESDVATLGLSATPPGHGLEGVMWVWPQERNERRRREKNKEKEKIKENNVIASLCVYIL